MFGSGSKNIGFGTHGGEFVLTVADDGAGFNLEPVATGMGLRSMRSRATESGGELAVDSAAGRGTTVRYAVPLVSAPTSALGLVALGSVAGVIILLLLSIRIGWVALVLLPLPLLELARLWTAWRRERRLTLSAA